MNSNCHELKILLDCQKGIKEKDYLERNENLWSYLSLLTMVEWDYSGQELERFGLLDFL
jgi:hypothetical protein